MRHTSLALACGMLVPAPVFSAALPDIVGPTVVVTPTRFSESAADRAVNVTVVSREDIERNPAVTLPEILRDQAGIGVRDLFGNNAYGSTVDLRGFGAAAGQNTLVLVDGVRQNDIDLSGVVWSAIPLSAIERIEIVRGGSSVLHGGGAVGGVINIITRAPTRKAREAEIGGRHGSFDTRSVQASGQLANGQAGVTLAAGGLRSDGWRDNNRNRQDSVYGNARWAFERGELGLKLGADRQDVRLPGARIVEPDQNIDELATDREGAQTPRDWASRDGWQAVLSGRVDLARGELVADLSHRDKSQASYFYFDGFPLYRETELAMLNASPRVRLPLAFGGLPHEVIAGVDLGQWDYRLLTSNDPASIGRPINRVDARQRNAALYVQDHVRLASVWTLTAGARVEWQRLEARDVYDSGAPGAGFGSAAGGGAEARREHAWELGIRHRVAPDQALYARAGRSFRFATVDEIYEYSASFNREFQFLKPQTAHDAELGWEAGTARRGGRVALYHALIKDEIHLDPYGSGIGNTNLPPLRRYGLELEGRRAIGPLELTAAYTLAFARFTDGTINGVALDGNSVPLVPRHTLALNASWRINAATRLTAAANYVGSQFMDNDEPNTLGVRIPAYTVADLKLEHRVGHWTWAAALNNVFDAHYHSYAVRSQFNADRYAAYPLPGRHGWISVEYAFR